MKYNGPPKEVLYSASVCFALDRRRATAQPEPLRCGLELGNNYTYIDSLYTIIIIIIRQSVLLIFHCWLVGCARCPGEQKCRGHNSNSSSSGTCNNFIATECELNCHFKVLVVVGVVDQCFVDRITIIKGNIIESRVLLLSGAHNSIPCGCVRC